MKRSALSDFLRSVVVATLASGCCSDQRETVYEGVTRPFTVDAGVGDPLPAAMCPTLCDDDFNPPKAVYGCAIAMENDGGVTEVSCDVTRAHCFGPPSGGRPPLGLQPRRAVDGDEVARFFAEMAHVEAAAVDGFGELAAALAAHGAPARLIAAAHNAADDERRHARVATALARRRGAEPPPVEIVAVPRPSLETLALANAREGCVVETWGAVVTGWQGRMAADGIVRRAFANIARDELRHAELARAVADWMAPRLDEAARRRVREARDAAVAALEREVARPLPRRLVVEVGLPDVDAARAMLAAMRARLWT